MSVSNVSASSSEAAFMPSGKTGFGGAIRPVGGGGGGGGGPAPTGDGPLGNWGGACKPPPIGAGFELGCGGKPEGSPPSGTGPPTGGTAACTPPFIGGPPLWPI